MPAQASMSVPARQRTHQPKTSPAKKRPQWSLRARIAAPFRTLCRGAEAKSAYERTRTFWRAHGALGDR